MANLHTVSNLKDAASALLSGVNVNSLDDLNATLERAISNVLARADVPEASAIQNISLYSGVTNYAVSPTIYGANLIDIRPQGISRSAWDSVTKTNQANFDRTKGYLPSGARAAFEYKNGVPAIRIVTQNTPPEVNIDTCTAVGNWVASGTASGLVVDTSVYYQAPASLRFTMTTGTGTLTETLSSGLDLDDYNGVGVAFLAAYIPDASTLTSVQLRIGSDSGNYASVTATTAFLGAFTTGDFNSLIAFDFSTASTTGTPNWSAIDYVQLNFAVTGTQTNFRVGGLFIALPSPNQILYISAAIFQATGGTTLSQSITADTDTIILNTPAYTIYTYESALAILENTGAGESDPVYNRLMKRLGVDGQGKVVGGLYAHYMGNNPSEQLRQLGTYYGTQNNWGYQSVGRGS